MDKSEKKSGEGGRGASLLPAFPLSANQEEGVAFCLSRRVAILNFQTGEGKCLCSLTAAFHLMRENPDSLLVVLCPAEANPAFLKELGRFNEPYALYEASGITGDRESRVHLFNFSSMERYIGTIQALHDRFRLIAVIDEAQALHHRGTKRARVFSRLRPLFTWVYALSATPLMNITYIQGLYHLIDYLYPGFLGTWAEFRDKYTRWRVVEVKVKARVLRQEEIIGIKNADALKERLSRLLLVRGRRYDLRYFYHSTPLTPKEANYYQEAGAGILKGSEREEFAARLHDLQRVVDWSHESIPCEFAGRLSSKEKLLFNLLRPMLSEGKTVLIYAEHHATIARLERVIVALEGKGFLKVSRLFKITGKETKKNRSEVSESMGPGSVTLCTQAGTQSRNLQKAGVAIIYDMPFIGRFIQFIGRIARMDTPHAVQEIHIIEAEGTIDTYKKALMRDAAQVYTALFSEASLNLPDPIRMDRARIKSLRAKLLWGFGAPEKRVLGGFDDGRD